MSRGACSESSGNVSSSANSWVYPATYDHRCGCSEIPKIRTSWTDVNPGRRFMGCCKFETGNGCEWFGWYDPPMCKRSKEIIRGLLRKISGLKETIKELEDISNLKELEEKRVVEKLEQKNSSRKRLVIDLHELCQIQERKIVKLRVFLCALVLLCTFLIARDFVRVKWSSRGLYLP